ncbi:protein AmbC [Acrocarpospora phusangensis]|uniref:Protein AmbC n=1 Tax=Acrocarpospora phusangensis TaxID=1070424 RepID=A0A919UPE0_9ACTN|nr:TauD/TfdA family dioxygenase [Acrocarpospora phusangensis]GIH25278.1 protein AmbC [Acrocarpospora phusangensis]
MSAPERWSTPPEAARGTAQAAAWLGRRAGELDTALAKSGAVLVRGMPLRTPADLTPVLAALGSEPSRPGEWFVPREELADRVYGPLPWPDERVLCPHPEAAYALRPPARLVVACLRAPGADGDAVLADGRAVLATLPDDLVAHAERTGWTLVRNFRTYVGVPWTAAFATKERERVESHCAAEAVTCEWTRGDSLRTTRRRPAVVRHPETGDPVWFNQLGFLSRWALLPDERAVLEAAYGTAGLPADTAFGDGRPLTAEEHAVIESAYDRVEHRFSWRAGDVLVLDNLLMAYGRRPQREGGSFAVAMLGRLALEMV